MSTQEHDGLVVLRVDGRIFVLLMLTVHTAKWCHEWLWQTSEAPGIFAVARALSSMFLLSLFLAGFIVDPPWKRKPAKRDRKVKLIRVE